MRAFLLGLCILVVPVPASAELWTGREGECGEWQSRWNMQQEQTGVWVGYVDYIHVGGRCDRPTGRTLRNEARAIMASDTLFIVRGGGEVCTHVAQIGDRRARGFVLCEGTGTRRPFVVRFRTSDERPIRELPPDAGLLDDHEEQSNLGRNFDERGLDDLFNRR